MQTERKSSQLPAGIVTFLLTDIEGSTRLWESSPSMGQSVKRHHELLERIIRENRGVRPRDQGEGDSLLAVFEKASAAAACALAIQRALENEDWPPDARIKVRMSLHSGEPDFRDQHNYMGSVVNRAARIRALAVGGQILVSESTASLLRDSLPEELKLKNLGSVQLRDLSRPETIFELAYPGVQQFPPLKQVRAAIHNLPVLMSSFVERPEDELRLRDLIAASRLVTVAGAGGSGKTRLALHVAQSVAEDFPDGVWVIDLATLSDRGLVPHKVAVGLGLLPSGGERAEPAHDLEQIMTTYLANRELLVVFDNCEHLIEPITNLTQSLMSVSPRLRILATTREVLGIPGEALFRMPSMSLPPDGAPLSVVKDHQAVQLFVDRAQQVRPGFLLDDTNAKLVSEVCAKVDGLPLAIELAAAKLKVMSLSEISERLSDHFRVLTGGSRTALERQQTLRGTVEWSYQLCTEKEQTLLRRLAVFVGGCSLRAAEEVCAGGGLPSDEIVENIGSLVDKSLVSIDDSTDETRFRMLETVRQFGREKLGEDKDATSVRDRHADFFLSVAESGDFPMHLADEPGALDRMDVDQHNLHSAIEWSLASGNSERACRLGWALYFYLHIRGFRSEATRWLREALSGTDISTVARAGAAVALARFAGWGEEADKKALVEDALTWSRTTADPQHLLLALHSAAYVALENQAAAGKPVDPPQELYSEAREAASRAGRPLLVIVNDLFELELSSGRSLVNSTEKLEDLLRQSLRFRFKRGTALAGVFLAEALLMRDQLSLALRTAREALPFAQDLRIPILEAQVWLQLGNIHSQLGSFDEAEASYLECLDRVERSSMSSDVTRIRQPLGLTRLEMGKVDLGRKDLEAFLELPDALSPFLRPARLMTSARIALLDKDYEAAAALATEGFEILEERDHAFAFVAASYLGHALALSERFKESIGALSRGIRRALDNKQPGRIAEMLDIAAYDSAKLAHPKEAATLLGLADAMRNRSGRVLYPSLQVFKNEAASMTQGDLGAEGFTRVYEMGQTRSVEEAVDLVLEIDKEMS